MPFLFLFTSKCFVNWFVERLLIVYITEHQYVISAPQQFNTFGLVCKSAGIRHGKLHEKTCYYFDELMKVYINIKNIKCLHPHQILNKRIGLMKRERKYNTAHRLSFGERFDEKSLNAY